MRLRLATNIRLWTAILAAATFAAGAVVLTRSSFERALADYFSSAAPNLKVVEELRPTLQPLDLDSQALFSPRPMGAYPMEAEPPAPPVTPPPFASVPWTQPEERPAAPPTYSHSQPPLVLPEINNLLGSYTLPLPAPSGIELRQPEPSRNEMPVRVIINPDTAAIATGALSGVPNAGAISVPSAAPILGGRR